MSDFEDTLLSRSFSSRGRRSASLVRKESPSANRLSELLDQLDPGAEKTPPQLFATPSKRHPYGGDQRPITNILRNPDQGFGPRSIPRSENSRPINLHSGQPVAMSRMNRSAQGSQPPAPPTPIPVAAAPAMVPSPAPAPEDALPMAARADLPGAAATPAPVRTEALPVQSHVPQVATGRGGSIIAMFSARGGVGATTIALNTAASLASRGNEVCVVDLSLELGDVFVALDLASNTSLVSVARDATKLDGSTLRRRMVRHQSGVWALGQEGNIDELGDDLAELLPGLFRVLSRHFDYVIIDGLRSFSEHALAALDSASQIQLVLGQDVMSVRRAARAIHLFRRLGYADHRLRLAVSRSNRKSPVTQYEIERSLQRPVAAMFRDDEKRVNTALNAGALLDQLAAAKGITQDIRNFAAGLDAERRQTAHRAELTVGRGGIAGFISRLFDRKGRS